MTIDIDIESLIPKPYWEHTESFTKQQVLAVAEAYAAKVLEDKEREIAELKERIEFIAELYSAITVEQIMRLQNDKSK